MQCKVVYRTILKCDRNIYCIINSLIQRHKKTMTDFETWKVGLMDCMSEGSDFGYYSSGVYDWGNGTLARFAEAKTAGYLYEVLWEDDFEVCPLMLLCEIRYARMEKAVARAAATEMSFYDSD